MNIINGWSMEMATRTARIITEAPTLPTSHTIRSITPSIWWIRKSTRSRSTARSTCGIWIREGICSARISLEGFTHEPTGVAVYVTPTGAQHLFITDDNAQKIFEVDAANPTVALRSFSTTKFGAVDPEDISINPNNGNLFVMSENDHTIYEITQAGTLVTKTVLPDTFVPHADPNAADAGAGGGRL